VIDARNANIGIFKRDEKSFEIRRIKFKDIFIYPEEHWETGEQHGTVKPYLEIELAPKFKNDDQKLEYLKNKEVELQHIIKTVPGSGHFRCSKCRAFIGIEGLCFVCNGGLI